MLTGRSWVVAAVVGFLVGAVVAVLVMFRIASPSPTHTGSLSYVAGKGALVCVRRSPCDPGPKVCGQYVEGTGGGLVGSLKVGDPIRYRVLKKNVSGALLVLIVSTA